MNKNKATYPFPQDLKIAMLWVILTDVFVLIPFLEETFIRVIFAWTMVIFLPGYVLLAFLFPEKNDLSLIERIALSFGLSAAITPVIGLGLNFTPFGIRLLPTVILLSFFIFLFAFLAHWRLRNLPAHGRFNENFSLSNIYSKILKDVKFPKKGLDRILFIIALLSVAFCIFTLVFVVTIPKQGEKFTEFYILNENGTADWYPTDLRPGEEGVVNVNVVSHEHEGAEYKLLIKWDDDNETLLEERLSLGHNEKWIRNFTFTTKDLVLVKQQGLVAYYSFERIIDTKKLNFLLYKDNEIYRKLHLYIGLEDTKAYDLSGNYNDGTVYGAKWVDGKYGEALRFNGKNTSVSVQDSDSLDITNELVIEAWIKPESFFGDCYTSGNNIVHKYYSDNVGQYFLTLCENKLRFTVCDDDERCDNIIMNVNITLGEWSYIVGIWNDDYMEIYINGKLEGKRKSTIKSIRSAEYPVDDLYIGHAPGGAPPYWHFNGTLDEVKIYNKTIEVKV